MKACNICRIEKDLSEFAIRDNGKHRNDCKKCRSLYLKEYRKGNKGNPYRLEVKTTKICRVCKVEKPIDEFIKSKRICKPCQKEYNKIRYQKHKNIFLEKSRIRYENKKEEIKIKNSEYSRNNREKINIRSRNYVNRVLRNNPIWIIKNRISGNIRNLVKLKGIVKKIKVRENLESILGCSVDQFISQIESQFLDNMSWDNRELWHIDHIIPQSFAENLEEIIMLNHYTNLRPMWSGDNIRKSNTIDENNELYIKIINLRNAKTS